jgi:hypothetical protein
MPEDIKKSDYEQYLYHNTEKLLKCYREVIWSIEVSLVQAKISFEIETDSKLEEFLGMTYAAGMNLAGTDVEEQVRTLERNRKMLRIIDEAANIIRKKQVDGETYYWILYYTYFSEKQIERVEEIVALIGQHVDKMSWRTYFRKRKDAVACFSKVLWGFTTKECLPILQEYVGTRMAQKKH